MEEIWKDIDGYEGLYQVSSFGNVKSLRYRGGGTQKNLTPKLNCKGYLWVILYRSGRHECILIHRLVGKAFVPNPHDFPFINHKDENPKNNNAENLEWCTGSYNVQYSLDRHPERKKLFVHPNSGPRKRINGKPYKHKSEIVQYSKDGQEINRFPNAVTVCDTNNWRTSSLIDCCKGKRKTAYGYIWRFASQNIDGRETI